MKILLLLLLCLPVGVQAQPVVQTKAQWTKSMDSVLALANKRNADTAAVQRKEWISADTKLLASFPAIRKATLDSLNLLNKYLSALSLRCDSLVKAFSGLNTAVWSNMKGVSGRLDSSIVGSRQADIVLSGDIDGLLISVTDTGNKLIDIQSAINELKVWAMKLNLINFR